MITVSAETRRPSRSRTPRMRRGESLVVGRSSLVVGGSSLGGGRWSLAIASPILSGPAHDKRLETNDSSAANDKRPATNDRPAANDHRPSTIDATPPPAP